MLKRLELIKVLYNLYVLNPEADQDFRSCLIENFLKQSSDRCTVLQFLDIEIDFERQGGSKDKRMLQLYASKFENDAQ